MECQLRGGTPQPLSLLLLPPTASTARTPGCHVSQVIRRIMRVVDPTAYGPQEFAAGPDGRRELPNAMEVGFLFENAVERALAAAMFDRMPGVHDGDGEFARFRPGELSEDGLIGSPDAAVVTPNGLTLEEYKCTWKSARHFDLSSVKFLAWNYQMQAYCHLLQTCHATLYVLFVNGEYGGNLQPQLHVYDITYAPQELADTWASLCNTARAEGWI